MCENIKIAYFSAEIGIDNALKTYSGGLGILSGDTIKAMADLSVPFCAVTLLYREGFFKQKISENDLQTELADTWDYENLLINTNKEIKIKIWDEDVFVKIWKYEYEGVSSHKIPIYYLDTNHEKNSQRGKEITQNLYRGDRIAQEIVLGIGGVRALRELNYGILDKYHMNEGHSAFLTLELYRIFGKEENSWDDKYVKDRCVFTTHTPIEAGHDKFDYDIVLSYLKNEEDIIPWHIKKLAGEDKLNMTLLALNLSSYANAVSKKHSEITKIMFKGYEIDYITNGVHAPFWASSYMRDLFDKYIPNWRFDSENLNQVFKIPNSELFMAHKKSKKQFLDLVKEIGLIKANLDENKLTIGFARRFISYKDAELIFTNLDQLKAMGKEVQFIFAGKSHANDGYGKEIMQRIIRKAKELKNDVSIEFLENYDIEIAKRMISGCDLWLNTPIPYNEASGTSGMKAAINGCMHFSRLDGWAIESFEKNGGGFPICEYLDFYTTLKYKLIPMFRNPNKTIWIENMKLSIGNSGSYFNTHRMAKEYLKKAYKL